MKKWLRFEFALLLFVITVITFEGCKNKATTNTKTLAINSEAIATPVLKTKKQELSEEFKKYWYAGDAELTSYKLEQARYGEIREGTSVLIFVTEPFLPETQVKADRNNTSNVPICLLYTSPSPRDS